MPASKPPLPNLCLLNDSFQHGGTERQFAELSTRLDRTKYNVILGCLRREGQFYEQVRAAGLLVYEFPVRGGWFTKRTAKSAWELARFFRRKRIELVHAFDIYTDIFAAPVARLARVPIVITSLRQHPGGYTPNQRWVQNHAFRWSDCVIANSQNAADCLTGADGLPPGRVRVLYNGVDLQRFQSSPNGGSARKKFGWAEDALLVGVVGNLRRQKDHRTLLDAAPEVVKRVPNVRFLIVGGGELSAELQRYAESQNLLSHVSFLGDRSDVPEILSAVDLTVLPTLYESMPNVILEAMSAGLPVIASSVGGCTELIDPGRSGYLVPPRDKQKLAEAITRLLQQPKLRQDMGLAARRRAETQFDINIAVKRLEAIYDEFLAKRAGNHQPQPNAARRTSTA